MDSPGFPDLEELSIASLADESRLINDEFIQRILKTSTKLQLLDVRGCARLTHDSLIRLPTWDLKHLFLSGCSVTRDTGYVVLTEKKTKQIFFAFGNHQNLFQWWPRVDSIQMGSQSNRI